jgi:hypothetical protein
MPYKWAVSGWRTVRSWCRQVVRRAGEPGSPLTSSSAESMSEFAASTVASMQGATRCDSSPAASQLSALRATTDWMGGACRRLGAGSAVAQPHRANIGSVGAPGTMGTATRQPPSPIGPRPSMTTRALGARQDLKLSAYDGCSGSTQSSGTSILASMPACSLSR